MGGPTKAGELLLWAAQVLRNSPAPAREARRALALATANPFFCREDKVLPFERARFRRIVEARARGVPWPVLEGTTAFLDFEVLVPPGVFIPRPETEELAELALKEFQQAPPGARAMDLGTGTGVLALALAKARPDAEVWAVDISPRALRAARRNAQRLGLKIQTVRSDGFSHIFGKFHLIVANPPYVAKHELPFLPKEVRDFEPRRALDGGEKGLSFLRRLVREAPDFLVPGGILLLEIAPSQKEELVKMAVETKEWSEVQVFSDLAGRPRFFRGKRC